MTQLDHFGKIAQGLFKAASMSADELAAKRGEDDQFVKIKRNSERLDACDRHEFEADPDWRERGGSFLMRKVRCVRCGGSMSNGDASNYLRGFAHGSGQPYSDLMNRVWPPK